MAGPNTTVLIKKIKKGHGHGHHGGAWKVAYADFVTAMMAFFLLLWLLSATTEEQREGIAHYFQPSTSDTSAGGDGLLGGQSISTEGAMPNFAGSPTIRVDANSIEEEGDLVARSVDEDGDLIPNEPSEERGTGASDEAAESDPDQESERPYKGAISDQKALERVAKLEEEQFKQAEAELREAIEGNEELKKLAENLIIDRTPDGMRIQIVDQANTSMFPIGSSEMHDYTKHLLQQVAAVVGKLPNKLAVSGHTDARPYASDRGYSNWELSSDRANASRRELILAGLPEERFASVTGRAEKDPFITDDPFSPRNRRISIVLLYEHRALSTAGAVPR